MIWTDETRSEERARFHFPRQHKDKFLCIADFFRPADGPEVDYAAFHIVTMGPAVSEATAKLFADDKYQEYLLLHGLGVEMAEALAELWHKRIREEWGFVAEDGPSLAGLFRQQYRGGRYSSGYPACPDLEDNVTILDLLDGARIGLECSEETGYQYQPEQTTSALDLPPPPGQVLRRAMTWRPSPGRRASPIRLHPASCSASAAAQRNRCERRSRQAEERPARPAWPGNAELTVSSAN